MPQFIVGFFFVCVFLYLYQTFGFMISCFELTSFMHLILIRFMIGGKRSSLSYFFFYFSFHTFSLEVYKIVYLGCHILFYMMVWPTIVSHFIVVCFTTCISPALRGVACSLTTLLLLFSQLFHTELGLCATLLAYVSVSMPPVSSYMTQVFGKYM